MSSVIRGRRLRLFTVLAMLATLVVIPAAPASAATSVFINEIHYDNAGTDAGEAIEVAGPAGTDLTGWSLVLYNGSGGVVYNTTVLSGVIPDQGGGFGTVFVSYPVNGIQNGSPDGVALVDAGSTVIQFLSYEGSFTGIGGPANGMLSTDIGVSEASTSAVGDSLQLTGTGTMYEDFTWAGGQPSTFGAVNTGQSFGVPTLVINEVDADQVSTDAAEFVELYDGGTGNMDLSGLVLVLFNGSDDASYEAFDLDGQATDADGYFVLCGDAANVANCDLDVDPDTNLIQNGADAVALFEGDAVDFPNDTPVTTAGLIDALVYDTNDADDPGLLVLLNAGQPQVNEGGGAAGSTLDSNQRCPNGTGGARNTDTYAQFAPTAGAANVCEIVVPPLSCDDDTLVFTPIHDIQGSGLASPLVGSEVLVEGVVVGDFDGTDQLNGFFVQEEDSDADADGTTSEGIFVFSGGASTVSVGDVVRVSGPVSEFFDLTEITVVELATCATGATLPTPGTITFPVGSVEDLEWFEGMSIEIPQQLSVSGNFTLGRFGEVDLSINGPLDNPTNVVAPGAAANALQDLNDRSRIQLDDGSTIQNPVPVPPHFAADGTLRTGDTVDGSLTGVLSYSFGAYEVQPTSTVSFTRDNARPAVPDVGGSIQVGAFNVLNYFTTIDGNGSICGPLQNQGCRGADSAEELADQRAKLISGISQIDAEVLGLMEIENAPDDTPTADLVAGLNDAVGAGTYDYIATGAIGTDAIRLAILYQPGEVTPVGDYAVLDASVDPTFNDERNRPALAQTFRENATGETFTIVVNHLKSKGSACDDIGDPDTGDGQGNCNLTRTAAAVALANWVTTDPTGQGDPDFLITGDLNAYAMEDPVTALEAAGFTDLVESFVGTGYGSGAYSFNFQSQSGYLDHALASASLAGQVTDTAFWHVNADEPSALDYNNFNQDELFNADQFRSSDHDPVLVGLNLDFGAEVTPTPGELWPPNHKYVTVEVTGTDGNGDPLTVEILGVTSSEADSTKQGDKGDDIVILGPSTVDLRAERYSADGRTYTITVLVTSVSGQVKLTTTTVVVPHDQGN
jgi:predicted extracellular nuclease